MKAQSRNRLGYLLSNEPCWPDPTESIGDFIKLIDGKKSCWKAKGRAREAFDVLADEIKTYLDKNVDSIPGSDWITWSIYMIGKTPQRAAPVVMFFCEEPRTRRRVQDVIKKSGILERYPGVKSGNAALPPDLNQLEPLASDAVSHTDTANTEGSDLKFTISVSRNSEVFVTGHHGDTSSTRLATLGGLVQHKGGVYGFTAGHPLDKSTTSYPPIELKAIDEEWEIDTDSDSDSDTEVDMYDKESMEAMNRASVTPVDARSATSSWSDDGSSDTDSTRSLQSSDSSTPIEDRSFCQPSQTQAASGQVVRNRASRDRNPAMDVHKFERNAKAVPASAVAEGRLVVLSTNLDYALIKFEDSSLLAVKDSVSNKTATNPLRPTHVIKTGPRDAEIITYTASGGLMTGTLHGTPSYTRLENSKTFQKVYTVRFNGVLAKGDCGSWVIDAETHGLYGHIIAGCERTRIAYIMAAHSVFEDAKERLGGELLLECDSASEAISPTDAAKTTEAALLEEVLDSSFRDPQGDHEQFNTKAEDWNFVGQSPSSVTKRESEQSTAIARERKQDTLVSTPQVWRECSQELICPSDLTRPAQSLPLGSLEEKSKHHQDSLRDFVLYPHQQQQSEMLVFESRHQQHYNPHFDMDAGLHQPYPDLTFNHVNSFESNSSYSTSYDMPSFAVSAPPPDMIKADHFHQPTPSASLPPTLSNASVPSVPSAASSAVGSPYLGNHGVPYTDGWTNVHGLGLMNNNGMVQDICFTTGMESEMVFAPDHKLTSFVDPSLIQGSGYASQPVPYGTEQYIPYQAPSPVPSPISSERSHPPPHMSPYLASHQPYPHPFDRRGSIQSLHSNLSRHSSSPRSGTDFEEGRETKGRCPNPDCGRIFKDLKAHMLTHQSERPEKCPILNCEYNQKGFARKYDKNRHTLTHYKGTMVCGFCPGSGSAAEKSFNRADVFKRHLTSVHGVEQSPPNARKRSPTAGSQRKLTSYSHDATGKCSTCSSTFSNAQDFYEHLDECVLRVVQQEEPSEAIDQQRLTEIASDPAVKETMERHMLSADATMDQIDGEDDDEEEDDDERDPTYGGRSGKGAIKSNKSGPSSRAILGTNNAITKISRTTNGGPRRGLTYSRGGVPLAEARPDRPNGLPIRVVAG